MDREEVSNATTRKNSPVMMETAEALIRETGGLEGKYTFLWLDDGFVRVVKSDD